MWERIRFWLRRDSRRMHCRAFCGWCSYFEQCRCDVHGMEFFFDFRNVRFKYILRIELITLEEKIVTLKEKMCKRKDLY